MTLPKIETFEHDIADEVLKKEASVVKIAAQDALVQDVQKEALRQKVGPSSPFLVSIIIALIVVAVLVVGGYFAYTKLIAKDEPAPQAVEKKTASSAQANTQATPSTFFERTFPELKEGLGGYVRKAEKTPYGFLITISEYTGPFSFVFKNEDMFADSISNALELAPENRDGPYVFTDVTLSNNNMRVGVSGSNTVVYAFVGKNSLLISTSTDGILKGAGAIIR
jgi:hypothetical protein